MEYNDLNNTIAYSITSTILRHGTYPTAPHASKVETQNLASHEQPYAIY